MVLGDAAKKSVKTPSSTRRNRALWASAEQA